MSDGYFRSVVKTTQIPTAGAFGLDADGHTLVTSRGLHRALVGVRPGVGPADGVVFLGAQQRVRT